MLLASFILDTGDDCNDDCDGVAAIQHSTRSYDRSIVLISTSGILLYNIILHANGTYINGIIACINAHVIALILHASNEPSLCNIRMTICICVFASVL